jgi:hypothetical protein
VTFMTEARKAENTDVPLAHRYWAMCHCIEQFAPLGFRATLDYLAECVGVTDNRWTSDQLASGLDLLMTQRGRYLEFDAQWVDRRRSRKSVGQRLVGRDELLERAAMPWLTWPRERVRDRRTLHFAGPSDNEFAFRPSQREDYEMVRAVMPAASHHWQGSFDVKVYDDWLRIPQRIYNPLPSPEAVERLSVKQVAMLHCLYSRHHDGRVRQRQPSLH